MSLNPMLRCPLDSIGYPNSDFLHSHILRGHPVRCAKLIRCIKCQKLFTELPALIKHRKVCYFDKNKKNFTGEFNFKCLKCSLSFNSLKKLADHICGDEEPIEASKCNICKVSFENQRIHDHHRLFHGFPKALLTDALILQLSSISYETMKSIRVTLNNVLQCLICKRQFDDFDSLIFHINIDHKKDLNYSQLINLNEENSYSNCLMAVVKHKSGRLKIIKQLKEIPLASKIVNLKNGVFHCNLCTKICLSMQFAVNHMLRHQIYFEKIKNLKNDLDQVVITKELSIDVGKFICKNCDVFFKSQTDLEQHLLRNHPELEVIEIKTEFFEDDFFDTEIPEYLSDDEDVVMKFVSETNDPEEKNQNKCLICGSVFYSKQILIDHVNRHKFSEVHKKPEILEEITEEPKENKCLICGSEFYSKQILIDHVKKHKLPKAQKNSKLNPEKNKCNMKNGKFECSICRSVLTNLIEMKGHMKCHSLRPINEEERMFKCFACEKEFVKEGQLKNHTRAVHGTDSFEGLKCEKCDKVFSIRKKYYAHCRHHLMMENPSLIEKNFKCKFCERSFKTSIHLKTHETIHTKERPFKCKLCDLCFRTPKHRTDHFRFDHLKEVGVACEICGKICRDSTLMAKHLKTHTGVKPHACEFCERRFLMKYDLVVHRRLHTGERPFICKFCNLGFVASTNLRKHINSRHKNQVDVEN